MSLSQVTFEIREWLSSCGLGDEAATATVTITFSKPQDAHHVAANVRREIGSMCLSSSQVEAVTGPVRNLTMNGINVRIGSEVHPLEACAIIFRDAL